MRKRELEEAHAAAATEMRPLSKGTDSRFEIEKRRGSWRLTATGIPALGIAFAFGLIVAAGVLWSIGRHVLALP